LATVQLRIVGFEPARTIRPSSEMLVISHLSSMPPASSNTTPNWPEVTLTSVAVSAAPCVAEIAAPYPPATSHFSIFTCAATTWSAVASAERIRSPRSVTSPPRHTTVGSLELRTPMVTVPASTATSVIRRLSSRNGSA
jgi:hypothetical protein